ncbi:MAG: undecaprenyl-diphosphate phosphatase [Planctomycetia bacterium]
MTPDHLLGPGLPLASALLEVWQALVLGVVEGLTEFLPVSSTGHLLLAQRALGLPSSQAMADFVVLVQPGAILAVLGIYRARLVQLLAGALGRDRAGLRLLGQLLLAFLPAAALGLFAERAIERHLYGLWPITAAWALGGVALLALARLPQAQPVPEGAAGLPGRRALHELGWRGALVVGAFQCAALLPGTSRSLATLVGGLVAGLSLAAAVEFSFLLGVLTLAAAAGWKCLSRGPAMWEGIGLPALAVGVLAAALSAALSVAFLLAWVRRHGLGAFGIYRLLLAVAVAALLLAGVLHAT